MKYRSFLVDSSEKDGYLILEYDNETFNQIHNENRSHLGGYYRLRIKLLLMKLEVI